MVGARSCLSRAVGTARRRRPLALLAALLSLATGCGSSLETFNPATHQGRTIANLFTFVMALSAVVFLLVVGLLLIILLRFRAQPGEGEPPQVAGNTRLEIAWIAGPVVIVVVLFVLAVLTMRSVGASSPDAMQVTVVGHQWWWEYRYPEGSVDTSYELHLPVGTPIELRITGQDVIHSFWVPQLGWKTDAIPGKTNTMRITLTQAGTFEGACAEYCGTQHAWMRIRVVAEPRAQFDNWLAQLRTPAAQPASDQARRGQQLFLSNTCVSCHTIRGTAANGTVGPDLTHLGSRADLGSGVLPNTPENLARWINQTKDVKPGVLMPSYNFSDADLAALVAYLEGLR